MEGNRLRYRWLLRGLVDELVPAPTGYEGRATLAGREYGRFRLYRPEQRKEAEVAMQFDDQLVRYLDEALAMEQSVVRMLDSVIHSFDDDDVKEALREHKLETERHIDRLRQRLEAHGQTPSLVREAGGIIGAMMKSVIDLTRCEKAARGVATPTRPSTSRSPPTSCSSGSRSGGDEETAEVARENRRDEERMAAWIDGHWELLHGDSRSPRPVCAPDPPRGRPRIATIPACAASPSPASVPSPRSGTTRPPPGAPPSRAKAASTSSAPSTPRSFPVRVAAEVKDFDPPAIASPKEARRLERNVLLALSAAGRRRSPTPA